MSVDSVPPRGIVITGAARGIGRATAELFLGRGWRVGLYDVDVDAVATTARELAEKYGTTVERVAHGGLDVRDRSHGSVPWTRSAKTDPSTWS